MLSVLDLSGNQLLTVEPSTFSGLADTLEHLNLHGNRIAMLPSEPIDLHALKTFDLSYNQLKEIPRHTFAAMSALTALNLSHNHHLALIPVTVFHPLTRLQTLDISSTGIKVLSAELFLRTTSLVRLHARNNGIAELPDTAFHSLSNLVTLDLSDNVIGNVRIGSFAGLTSVRRVNLARNKLTSFKGEYFVTKRSDGTALEELDLSGNQISYLFPSTFKVHPGVRTVDLSDNKFSTFPSELLAGLSRLRHVDLSRNSLIAVGEFGFAGLPRLRRLSLARNRIDAISETAFHNSTQLQYVDLAGNRLDRIGERTFQGLGRLRYLGLDDNALTELPDTVFDRSRLRTLEHVNLAGNAFVAAPLRSLHAQYASLTVVDLSRNRLTELAEPGDATAAAAAALMNVERLDVSFNRLSAAAVRRLLSEPKTVRDLNMAGTGMTAVPPLETPFLRKLNVSHNEIDAVDERAFDRATLLEELDVSDNRLRSLAPFRPVWPKLGRLQTLDVSHNPIAGIVHGDWDGLGSLRRLRAHHLPECDRIERSAFRPLTNLVELRVYGLPKLGYMDVVGLLGRLQSLETLDVEVKDATVGGQLSVAMSPRLESLTVRGHRVAHISSGALAGIKCRNVRVRISDTSVTALPASLLVPLPRSSSVLLDVAGNQLATLTSQFLAALDDRRGLVRLDGLRSNPVRCDCNARALRRSPLAADLVCAAPGFVAGSLLIEIPDDDLTCDVTRQTTTTTATTTTTGAAITAVTAAAATVGKSPRTTTAEPDIIWSLPPATVSSGAAHHPPGPPGPPRMTGNNGKQQNPALTSTATNDDTLIIGIVAGVVVFIAILVVIICIVRIRLSTAEYNSHLNALPPVLGSGAVPAYCHGPAAYPMRMQPATAAHSYANSYATLPAHKLSTVSSPSPPYVAHNPYYVHPYGGAADEKDYAAMIMR